MSGRGLRRMSGRGLKRMPVPDLKRPLSRSVTGPCYFQCLLFVVHKGKIPNPEEPDSPPLDRAQVSVYILIPHIDGYYDRLCRIFACSGITVLESPQINSSFTKAITEGRVELFDTHLDRYSIDSQQLIFYVDSFNEDILNMLFGEHCVRAKYGKSYKSCMCKSCQNTQWGFHSVWDEENLNTIEQLAGFGTEIRYRHEDSGTILHFAVRERSEALARVLLNSGAQVDARSQHGRTPLHTAAECEVPISISRLLIQNDADVNATITGSEDYAGVTALHFAVITCNNNLISHLLDCGASVDANSSLGSVLQLVVEYDLSSVVLKSVLRRRPDVQSVSNQKALPSAVKHPCKEIFEMVGNYGFNTLVPENAEDVDLLFNVVEKGYLGYLKDLVKWGATVYANRASSDRQGDIVGKLLIKAFDHRQRNVFNFLMKMDTSQSRLPLILTYRNDLKFSRYYFEMIISGDLDVGAILETVNSLNDFGSHQLEFLRPFICRHIYTLKAANLAINETLFQNLNQLQSEVQSLPTWLLAVLRSPPLPEHALEVIALESEMLGDSDFTYHDLLNKSVSNIAPLMKNNSVVQVLETKNYRQMFPSYWPQIEWRFRKALHRRKLMDTGLKMFSFLFKQLPELPCGLPEKVLSYLDNFDLLVLANICELPASESESEGS